LLLNSQLLGVRVKSTSHYYRTILPHRRISPLISARLCLLFLTFVSSIDVCFGSNNINNDDNDNNNSSNCLLVVSGGDWLSLSNNKALLFLLLLILLLLIAALVTTRSRSFFCMRRKLWRRGKQADHSIRRRHHSSPALMDLNLMAATAAGSSGRSSSNNLLLQQQQQAAAAAAAAAATAVPPYLTPENVASVPPPGLSAPSQAVFSPQSSRYLAYIAVVPKQSSSSSSSGSSSSKSAHAKSSSRSSAAIAFYRPLTASANSTPSTSTTTTHATINGTSNNKNTKNTTSSTTGNNNTLPDVTSQSVSSHNPVERVLLCLDLERIATLPPQPLLQWSSSSHRRIAAKRRAIDTSTSLEERLRRERQRSLSGSLTEFRWVMRQQQQQPSSSSSQDNNNNNIRETSSTSTTEHTANKSKEEHTTVDSSQLRLLIPARGSLYIQDGIDLTTDDEEQSNSNTTSTSTQQQQDVQCNCIHDKSVTGLSAVDAQLSPDGSMVAWTADGELYVQAASHYNTGNSNNYSSPNRQQQSSQDTTIPAIRVSFGACQNETTSISHGVADFVAQEEMDRYRGFWWHPDSNAILFTRNDESAVPLYRILHHNQSSSASHAPSTADASGHGDNSSHGLGHHHTSSTANSSKGGSGGGSSMFEDHRYPFAGKMNPAVKLGLVEIDRTSVRNHAAAALAPTTAAAENMITESRDVSTDDDHHQQRHDDDDDDPMQVMTAQDVAAEHWAACQWLDAPREATEYLARVHWVPDGCAVVQWQDRTQKCTVLQRLDLRTSTRKNEQSNAATDGERRPGMGRGRTLLVERSDVWINLHHMFHVLSRPIHPDEFCDPVEQTRLPTMPQPLPEGSFSFLFASERTGYAHLYLYTYCPGVNGEQAVLLRNLTSGNWMVESILGVDLEKDVVYFTGTYDSVLERHLYATPLLGKDNVHTWRRGASAAPRSAIPEHEQRTSPPGAAIPMALASSGSDDSLGSSPATVVAMQSPISSSGATISNASSPSNNSRGVRRGLSKVMHALSGKGGKHKAENRFQPVEIALTSNSSNTVGPTRLTVESGMHSIVMDDNCRYFVDTCSDLNRPTTVKIYELPTDTRLNVKRILTLYDAVQDDKFMPTIKAMTNGKKSDSADLVKNLPAPELLSFPTSDGAETLHAAIYKPDPKIHGPGPYPLVCAVYGGPHVQRVNRSWSQCSDMRAQRLRSLGFCVVKCDNRGSSRRGLSFESAISRRLGRFEVLDQVAAVRQLIVRGIADASRVGIYGWSYGGYLSAMCLCRAPDVFHVAVAGAPVTSWDGYDTHYTERYMGLPTDNAAGYRESAVFDHIPNMRGRLMIVHGLIDENVHFRHTTRLINKLIAAGKDYDLLIFPDERHSPRRLRDRIYMEKRISDYFVAHLGAGAHPTALDLVMSAHGGGGGGSTGGMRAMAGHL